MGAFTVLDIAGSSMGMHQTWLDALANNISNVNTTTGTDGEAFRAQMVVARSREDGGVEVAGIKEGSAEGRLVHDPTHPLADADGYVRRPDIELSDQMGDLIMAQRGYQASVQVTKYAQTTYDAALQIGR
ncbi:flagellar basal body rod protein FlgC [Nocardioides yefusunii]|uniref:Flagellar basal body rod protein FlgC n=1 Tax=Nocardioides yefusunii TaxID=2500546 RepID=A0ABW1QX54_9ACTN|nr:flagellar basal body rod C-terminal domain-containing protein [Nocardioides yefusunii]